MTLEEKLKKRKKKKKVSDEAEGAFGEDLDKIVDKKYIKKFLKGKK